MKKRFISRLMLLISVLFLSSQSGYSFELNGFADVSVTKSTEGADEFRNVDFAFGTLDLYFAQTLDDIDILLELGVEEGDEMDVERVTIGYTFSDALKVRAGRFHTPLGFWNTSYHHGVQLQPTIERPDFLKFEDDGGILPTHVVGASLGGRVHTGIGAVEYTAMIGNGPQIVDENEDGALVKGDDVLSPNNISDNNIGKAVAFNAAISPSFVSGLKLGVSGHISEIRSFDGLVQDLTKEPDSLPAIHVDQTIYAFAATYTNGPLSMAAE